MFQMKPKSKIQMFIMNILKQYKNDYKLIMINSLDNSCKNEWRV